MKNYLHIYPLPLLLFKLLIFFISTASYVSSSENDDIFELILPVISIASKPPKPCIKHLGSYVQATRLKSFYINPNECLVSENRKYMALMQADGNFVTYPTDSINAESHIWNSETYGFPNSGVLIQHDGMFFIYRQGGVSLDQNGDYKSSLDAAIWYSSGAWYGKKRDEGKPISGDFVLIMQDDGRLVHYEGIYPYLVEQVWDSSTSPRSIVRGRKVCWCGNYKYMFPAIPFQNCENDERCGCARGELKDCKPAW